MDRGSRLMTFFQTLEKLNQQRQTARFGAEDLQQLRYTTAKIVQFVSTTACKNSKEEKVHRDLILKNSEYLDQLLTTLQCAGDTCTEQNIVWTLNELLGKTHTGKKANTLVSHGAINVLLQTLVFEAKEPNCSDELLISIHQVLSKLGPKDRKFGVKGRLSQALGVTLSLVKNYCTNPKLVQPIVHVLKLYANNAVNASYLGKNGAVSYLFKVLSSCQKKHLALLKYSLDALSSLVKSKSNSARVIGQGGVPVLLIMFQDWHRVDSKNRHIALRKAILTVLKHITNLKCGREALMEAEGIRVLYTACQESIDVRELESLIFMASLVMRKCFPKNRLPIANLRSPITCPVPESEFHVVDAGEGVQGNSAAPACSAAAAAAPVAHAAPAVGARGWSQQAGRRGQLAVSSDRVMMTAAHSSAAGCADDNGYESSVDNDDDLSSDDDPEAHKVESDEDGDGDVADGDLPHKRTADDLQQYATFFPELTEFDAILEDTPGYNDSDKPIVIPTASYDAIRGFRGCQSAANMPTSQSAPSLQQKSGVRYSMPNVLQTPGEELLSSGFHCMRVNANESDFQSDNTYGNNSHLSTRSRLKGYFDSSESSSEPGPSAVNLKTGSSVFTLEFSPKQPRKSLHTKSPKPKKKKVPTATLR